jgi:hypothetical protein
MTEEPEYIKIIREWAERNKPPTLKEKIEEWYDTANFAQSKDVITNEIVNIVKEWLPPSSPTNTYDWEKCLSLMRGKLR